MTSDHKLVAGAGGIGETPGDDDDDHTADEVASSGQDLASHERGYSLRQRLSRSPGKLKTIVLSMSIVLAAVLAGGLYEFQYRPLVQTNAQVAETVTTAAREGTAALLSYSPDSLQRDFEQAKSHLTGKFLDYYNQFTTQVVTPAATEKKVRTEAKVVRAAVTELHPGSAKVLVFIDQNTTSADKPDPALTASSVLVTLDKQSAKWLISAFDPV